MQGNWDKAINAYEVAKKLAPLQLKVRQYLRNAYIAAKRFPEAVKELRELVEREPNSEPARTAWAKALRAEGWTTEAARVQAGPAPEAWNSATQ